VREVRRIGVIQSRHAGHGNVVIPS
jgi:hypothetical protein